MSRDLPPHIIQALEDAEDLPTTLQTAQAILAATENLPAELLGTVDVIESLSVAVQYFAVAGDLDTAKQALSRAELGVASAASSTDIPVSARSQLTIAKATLLSSRGSFLEAARLYLSASSAPGVPVEVLLRRAASACAASPATAARDAFLSTLLSHPAAESMLPPAWLAVLAAFASDRLLKPAELEAVCSSLAQDGSLPTTATAELAKSMVGHNLRVCAKRFVSIHLDHLAYLVGCAPHDVLAALRPLTARGILTASTNLVTGFVHFSTPPGTTASASQRALDTLTAASLAMGAG
jgi:hypothetical protein